MNATFARVVQNERLYGGTFITWFHAPEICTGAEPGQFVMLRCAEHASIVEAPPDPVGIPNDPLLPRAMSIHRLRRGAHGPEWAILYDVVGRGTGWLATREAGDTVFCWGPLGHGFSIDQRSQNLLLIGGGIGIAPLVWLADVAAEAGKSITLVVAARTHQHLFPASMLPPQVEVINMTEDGSAGTQGLATQAFIKHLEWCDQAFACGPNAMFAAMSSAGHKQTFRRGTQVLLEERMGCGTGICYGCAIKTRRGMRLVCKDGPRFELRDLLL